MPGGDEDLARDGGLGGVGLAVAVLGVDAEGRIAYRGAPDADYADPSDNAASLRDALDAVLAGAEPAVPEAEPVGCSFKWKR